MKTPTRAQLPCNKKIISRTCQHMLTAQGCRNPTACAHQDTSVSSEAGRQSLGKRRLAEQGTPPLTTFAFGLFPASHRWLHCLVYLTRLFGRCYIHLRCLRLALAWAVSWMELVPSAQLPISALEQMTTNINKGHVVSWTTNSELV